MPAAVVATAALPLARKRRVVSPLSPCRDTVVGAVDLLLAVVAATAEALKRMGLALAAMGLGLA